MQRNLYLSKNGKLSRRESTIYYNTAEGRHIVPVTQVKAVFLTGHVSITSGVIAFFSKIGIPLHFFGHYGNYLGSYMPRKQLISGNTVLNQTGAILDTSTRQEIAKAIVSGCIRNMVHVLVNYTRGIEDLSQKADALKDQMDVIDIATSIGELMSIEGRAWSIYYSAFDLIINEYDMGSRIKRPPNNPVNALISFGNSLLYGAVLTQIYHTQLDPSLSFLHEPLERRFSLALDIAEVFKPTIVDTLIFRLLNKRILSENHFDDRLNYCIMNETGRKVFLNEFDGRLRETLRHPKLKRNVSREYLIRLDCYKLVKKVIEGRKFSPFSESRGR